ncbi:hypothetical protein [Burkholderia pseudomallei]|uniref:hypothetical protein n=1 Tax=Burkholderia pseudomallei TaxID=28450 RepID=UPI000F088938|nr:hypothetical protein [Burkholderia pseudomallei]VBP13340.1 Uncharacterised protein [Burkholderia pseudomallei]
MTGKVTDIQHPNEVAVGTLARLTAVIESPAEGKAAVVWTYTEPGRKPQPLGKGLAVIYIAPAKLASTKVKITAKNKGTAAFTVEIPVVQPALAPPTDTVKCALDADWSKDAADHAATIDGGAPFLVGSRKTWKRPGKKAQDHTKYCGLTLNARFSPVRYSAQDFPQFGHWADLIACSVQLEGLGAFEALNTWDHVNFTFGLIQFTAQAYGADLHELLRRAFKNLPQQAGWLFPELKLLGNDFHGRDPATGDWRPLTNAEDKQNIELRGFLKPVKTEITRDEVLFAARLIHWTRAEPKMRALMVEMAVERAKANMRDVEDLLDGMDIAVCAAVFDIRLQGRDRTKGRKRIRDALASAQPLDELLAIHGPGEKLRIDHLTIALQKRFAGSKVKYDKKTHELK